MRRRALCLLAVLALAGCGADRDVRRLNLFENSIEKPNNPEAPAIDQQLILCKYGPILPKPEDVRDGE